MHLSKTLPSGANAAVIVRHKTKKRLRATCFRGLSVRLAGNFLRWSSSDELFRDPEVMKHFLAELDHMWSQREFATHSVTISHSLPVGWESTAPREQYHDKDLEPFTLSRRAWGLRVKLDCTHLRAPQTHELTLVYEFKCEDGTPVAVIHSIYPGSDIGELNDDVTAREQCIFFGWNHPGQP